ncbi:MAG: DUF928 domain-containing protein [Cyanobacteria bacterium P01_A01_bin.105]
MRNCDRTLPIAIATAIAKRGPWAILLGSLLAVQPVLAAPTPGLADATQSAPASQVRWRPNPDRGTATSTLSGGRRGTLATHCAADGPTLALLVPEQAAGLLTTQAEPTVAWHVETDRPVAMELMLSHPDQAAPVYQKTITADQSDIVQVTLPELEDDTRYRWTVFLTCDNSGHSEIHSRSFIQRVDRESASLTEEPLDQLSPLDQATAYADAGIWYDACQALLQDYAQTQSPDTLAAFYQLLGQANPAHPLVATGQ